MKHTHHNKVGVIAKFVFALGVITALIMPLAALGARFELWHFRAAFAAVTWNIVLAIVTMVLGLLAIICSVIKKRKKSLVLILLGLVLAIATLSMIAYQRAQVENYPFIHDITTDTNSPPQFAKIVALRPEGSNSLIYEGQIVAQQQQNAYPQIQPIIVAEPAQQAFERALKIAHNDGWEIVDADAQLGIIEATDTTFWFGFKDDIVIRIQALDGGDETRVDIRSVSRVGRSDLGKNASRIESFINQFKQS